MRMMESIDVNELNSQIAVNSLALALAQNLGFDPDTTVIEITHVDF